MLAADSHLSAHRLQAQSYIYQVFRLSPCSECSLCSFGNFPGVRSIKADVSELVSVPSSWAIRKSPRTMETTLSPETSAFLLRTPGKFPKEHRLYLSSKNRVWSRNTGQSNVGWLVNLSSTVVIISTTWLNTNLCVFPTKHTCVWCPCTGSTERMVTDAVAAVWGRSRHFVPLHDGSDSPSVGLSHLEVRWTNFFINAVCRLWSWKSPRI